MRYYTIVPTRLDLHHAFQKAKNHDEDKLLHYVGLQLYYLYNIMNLKVHYGDRHISFIPRDYSEDDDGTVGK